MLTEVEINLTPEAQIALNELLGTNEYSHLSDLISRAVLALHRQECPTDPFRGPFASGLRML